MISVSIEVYTLSKFRISNYIGILSLVCIITVFSGSYISQYQATLSKEKAKVIIEALNNYKSKNNQYPENLSELVPEYLESVPSSMMGWFDEPFKYHKGKDGSLNLTFPRYVGDMYLYSSSFSKPEWIETD